jgi:predicted house-cleaning noncanonical NTP pyrophosphatase (MazG superfamily)
MRLAISDEKLKKVMKEAIIEAIQEKKKEFYNILLEAIEEIALANAIKQGRKNKFVSEKRILKTLRG